MSRNEDIVRLVVLTNAMRKRWRRKSLKMDAGLTMMAADRADNMSANSALIHVDGPAENIGFGFENAEDALKGWMNSPDHRDNIVNKEHTHMGVGLSISDGIKWWCVLFGSSRR